MHINPLDFSHPFHAIHDGPRESAVAKAAASLRFDQYLIQLTHQIHTQRQNGFSPLGIHHHRTPRSRMPGSPTSPVAPIGTPEHAPHTPAE